MNKTPLLYLLFFCHSLFSTSSLSEEKQNSSALPLISTQSVEQDIQFLASDELKGRATFTPEIDLAANYIAKRFKNIGLTTFKNNGSFLQNFNLYQLIPDTLTVEINGNNYRQQQLALATNQQEIQWHSLGNIELSVIAPHDDFYQQIDKLNRLGGQHLVLVNNQHKDLFKRFRQYFNKGFNHQDIANPATILLVLTQTTTVQSINVVASNKQIKQSLNNVVGVLPGTSKADEMIIFSAHYDHLGVTDAYNDSNASDTIFNGADDDASGTTAVIQLAQYFKQRNNHHNKKYHNQRTLVFVAFTAEEIGGFGSKYFSLQLAADSIKAMVNIEMIGKSSSFGDGNFWMTGFERSNLAAIMNETLSQSQAQSAVTEPTKAQHKIHPDPYPKQELFYRSDNATLARLGVPAHSFSSTQLDKDKHYHQVSDEVDTLDLPAMTKVINNIAIASQALVDGSKTPSRVDTRLVTADGKVFK